MLTLPRLLLLLLAAGPMISAPAVAAAANKAGATIEPGIKPVSAKELERFARAAREVFRVRQAYAPKVQAAGSEMNARDYIVAAEREMGNAIRGEGLTVERYNEILRAAQRDPALAGRIQSLVDKAAAGK
jgi:hypothetical protein